MKTMKEEEESDTDMPDLPEEAPQIVKEEEDKIFKEGDDEDDMEDVEIETDASGMRRRMRHEKEEQEAIDANTGASSDTINVENDDAAPSAPMTEPDVSDPVVTLRVEQFSVVEDVQIRLSRRPDVDGDFPFYGVDEDGNYADPPDEQTLFDWAEKYYTRHPKEFVWIAFRGGLLFKKLLQYSLACGLTRDDFQAEFGAVQTDKAVLSTGDEREKLRARGKALQDLERQSEFVRRLYRGAFECTAYSYFRPDTKGMQGTIFIPPDEVILATRENTRKISAIYMTDFHGYTLPPKILNAYYKELEKVDVVTCHLDRSLFAPAVLYPVTAEMQLWTAEQFGPVVPIAPFDRLEQPIEWLRKMPFGQQTSIFTSNQAAPSVELSQLLDMCALSTCRVNLNAQCQRGPDMYPFAGRRSSAMGTISVEEVLRAVSVETMVASKSLEVMNRGLESVKNLKIDPFVLIARSSLFQWRA
eukprot:s3038_g20.t1